MMPMPRAHPWHAIASRAAVPDVFHAFIELVPGDTVKFEVDRLTGHLLLDRPQQYSSQCPAPYGFIPRTACGPRVAQRCTECAGEAIQGDGDPIDICVLTEKQFAHGNCLVRARPIGGLRMVDRGQANDKIIAVLESDLAYGALRNLSECPATLLERLKHYFLTYKQRPDDDSKVRLVGIYGRDEALEMISLSVLDYSERWGDRWP